jgi:hypothetical protein
MAGICSEHQTHEPDCTTCNALIYAAIKPGTYKHFKGGLYEVGERFLSFNVEGREATPLICYTRRGTSEPAFNVASRTSPHSSSAEITQALASSWSLRSHGGRARAPLHHVRSSAATAGAHARPYDT